jgi:MSHA biogenesis protein MshP
MSTTCPERRAGGFAIVSAIFILVVLASLAGFIVSVTATQSLTFAQDIQGARAYQAARAGTEWGIARWLGSTTSAIEITNCPGTPGLPVLIGGCCSGLDGFDVEIHTGRSSGGGINFCSITATARPTGMTSANVGSLGYVEREMRVVIEGIPPP